MAEADATPQKRRRVQPPAQNPTSSAVASLTAEQLRDELRARHLDTSGLKAVLRERLEGALAQDPQLHTVSLEEVGVLFCETTPKD
jgi:hypothetical protein